MTKIHQVEPKESFFTLALVPRHKSITFSKLSSSKHYPEFQLFILASHRAPSKLVSHLNQLWKPFLPIFLITSKLNQFETIYMQQTMSHSHMLCLLSLYNFAFINNSIATIQSSEILEPTYLSIIICSMIFLILLVMHLNRVIWNYTLDLFNTWASYINNHKKITLIFDNLHKTCSHAWTKLLVI